MSNPDFNLLVTLDVLLSEGSVARAARRLGLSPSAMSRALARVRSALEDPLLVRAGRGLVLTPRAVEIRARAHDLVLDVSSLLRPVVVKDLRKLVRIFTIRTSEGFVENFGSALLARVASEAPGVRLHFLTKPNKESTPLREGSIDLETGVMGQSASPELQVQKLFRDRFVGVMRASNPLARGRISLAQYGAALHVCVSRKLERRAPWEEEGSVDSALEERGRKRQIATWVGGFATALALVRQSDLIATVPERHTGVLREGLVTFELPFPVKPFEVSLLWHPRLGADAGHQWLRSCIREICAKAIPQ